MYKSCSPIAESTFQPRWLDFRARCIDLLMFAPLCAYILIEDWRGQCLCCLSIDNTYRRVYFLSKIVPLYTSHDCINVIISVTCGKAMKRSRNNEKSFRQSHVNPIRLRLKVRSPSRRFANAECLYSNARNDSIGTHPQEIISHFRSNSTPSTYGK